MSEPTVVLYVRVPVEIKTFLDELVLGDGSHWPRRTIQSEVTRILRESRDSHLASKRGSGIASKPRSRDLASKDPAGNRRLADRRGRGARISDPKTWSKELHAEIDKGSELRVDTKKSTGDLETTPRGTLVRIDWPGTLNGKHSKMAKFVKLTKNRDKAIVQVERVDRKGKPLGSYGSWRTFPVDDVIAIGPFR